MSKIRHFPKVLTNDECENLHERLLYTEYSQIIGFSRKKFHYSSEVLPGYDSQRKALGELALMIYERVDWFPGFNPEKWRAAVNIWSTERLVSRPYFMGAHRDDIGANVGVVSINGKGVFISGTLMTSDQEVVPGDVVVMKNKVLLPPRHDVRINTDTRMSVAIWNA